MSQLLKRSPQRFPVQHRCYLRIRQVVQIIQPVLLCYSLLLRFPVCTGGLSPGNFLAVLLRHRITLTLHSDSRILILRFAEYNFFSYCISLFGVEEQITFHTEISITGRMKRFGKQAIVNADLPGLSRPPGYRRQRRVLHL